MPQIILDDPDGTLAMLRDSVAGLAERHSGAQSLRAKRSSGADSDRALWALMAEAGWTSLLLPEALGGAELGLAEQAVLSEALGRALVCEPLATTAVFASVLLREAPASAERDRLAGDLVAGTPIAVAWQDAAGRPLAVSQTADGAKLSGELAFVDLAAGASSFLVVAGNDGGGLLLSIPADAPGLSIDLRASVDGGQIGRLRFADCHVAAERILARAASKSALLEAPVAHARVALAAELAGIASRAVEMTIAYTKDRVQFGKPIASFQAIQHRLVEMWGDAEFACASVANAIQRSQSGNAREAALSILAAKARCGDAASSVCRRAVHLHGAMGFTDEHDIGLYLKRAVALTATLGQPEALRLQFLDLERAA